MNTPTPPDLIEKMVLATRAEMEKRHHLSQPSEAYDRMKAAARVMLEAMRMRPGVRRSGDTFAFYNIDQWLDAFAKEKGLD